MGELTYPRADQIYPIADDRPGHLDHSTSLLLSIDFNVSGLLLRIPDGHRLASHMSSLSIIDRGTQRRSTARYRLHLPVIFHWNDGGECTAGGFTYDVALNGALISSTKCPPIGCDIRIEVLVPSPSSESEQLRIQCVGKVIRAVTEGDSCSFGVRGLFDDDNIKRLIVIPHRTPLNSRK
jgi:hypothetical protein